MMGCGECGQPESGLAHTPHSPYDNGGGLLFDRQRSDVVPKMVPFSINKWHPCQLTRTPPKKLQRLRQSLKQTKRPNGRAAARVA